MGDAVKVHHEVGTKASNKIVDQGVVHIVTLEYGIVERDNAGKVDKEQRTRIIPAAFDVVVDDDDDVMVVKQQARQLKTTAQGIDNSRKPGVNP